MGNWSLERFWMKFLENQIFFKFFQQKLQDSIHLWWYWYFSSFSIHFSKIIQKKKFFEKEFSKFSENQQEIKFIWYLLFIEFRLEKWGNDRWSGKFLKKRIEKNLFFFQILCSKMTRILISFWNFQIGIHFCDENEQFFFVKNRKKFYIFLFQFCFFCHNFINFTLKWIILHFLNYFFIIFAFFFNKLKDSWIFYQNLNAKIWFLQIFQKVSFFSQISFKSNFNQILRINTYFLSNLIFNP